MLFTALLACTSLPDGWEDARKVEDFAQSECDGSPYDTGLEEAMSAETTAEGLLVVGDPLHFRCEQEVEGFWREQDGGVAVLVQPVDMHPRIVAACDCLYRVEAVIPVEAPTEVTLYRRWDAINDPNPLVEIGSASVE